MVDDPDRSSITRRWNRYAALFFLAGLVISIIGPVILMIVCPQPPLTNLQAFLSAYRPVQSFVFVPSLALPLSIVAVLAAFHFGASSEEKKWSLLALAWGVVGATVLFNYLVQGVFVPSLVRQGSEIVGILVSTNPGSLFWTLEMFGYALVGLGMWAAAPLIHGAARDRLVRWVLAVNAIGSTLAALAIPLDSSWLLGPIGLAFVLVWNILMLLLAVLLIQRSCRRELDSDVPASPPNRCSAPGR